MGSLYRTNAARRLISKCQVNGIDNLSESKDVNRCKAKKKIPRPEHGPNIFGTHLLSPKAS